MFFKTTKKTSSTRKKILLSWELGGHLGHLLNLRTIAVKLEKNGYDTLIAASDLKYSQNTTNQKSHKILQAPYKRKLSRHARPHLSISDILADRGYGDPQELSGLVQGWRTIFQLYQPDLIIADYAPTALLASRAYKLRRVSCGNGFGELIPGCETPFFRDGSKDEVAQSKSCERTVLKNINTVALESNLPEFEFVSDIYKTDRALIANISELDIFNTLRPNAEYIGPIYNRQQKYAKPKWPASENNFKVFCYLKYNPQAEKILRALTQLPCDAIVFLKGYPGKIQPTPNIHIYTEPLDIHLSREADLTICEGGSTLPQSLLFGTPVLLAPSQAEQVKTAKIALTEGVSEIVWRSDKIDTIKEKILKLTKVPIYQTSANNLKNRYSAFSPGYAENIVLNTCNELLHSPPE